MLQTRLATSTAFLVLSISVAHAQSGPKDGLNSKPTDLAGVNVGATAPDFMLEDIDGTKISLSDFRGTKNVILVFYRGQW